MPLKSGIETILHRKFINFSFKAQNSHANNPVIGLRSFSDSADIVSRFGSAVLKGLDEYNVIGLPVNIPEFDAANKSYSRTNMLYERGFGLSYDKK